MPQKGKELRLRSVKIRTKWLRRTERLPITGGKKESLS
jgi:hypothetical protein